MEIEYLKDYNETSGLNGVTPEGISLDEIVLLEEEYNKGKAFPKTFREYLFIGGNRGGTGIVWNDWEMLNEDLQEFLEVSNFTLDRPVFVYNMRDGGDAFSFFYLDEDKEDPDAYLLLSGDSLSGTRPYVKSANGYTFSGLINEAIRRIKNGIPF